MGSQIAREWVLGVGGEEFGSQPPTPPPKTHAWLHDSLVLGRTFRQFQARLPSTNNCASALAVRRNVRECECRCVLVACA